MKTPTLDEQLLDALMLTQCCFVSSDKIPQKTYFLVFLGHLIPKRRCVDSASPYDSSLVLLTKKKKEVWPRSRAEV